MCVRLHTHEQQQGRDVHTAEHMYGAVFACFSLGGCALYARLAYWRRHAGHVVKVEDDELPSSVVKIRAVIPWHGLRVAQADRTASRPSRIVPEN